jgi:hypothetical protein
LQGVAGALVPHIPAGQTAHPDINQRDVHFHQPSIHLLVSAFTSRFNREARCGTCAGS